MAAESDADRAADVESIGVMLAFHVPDVGRLTPEQRARLLAILRRLQPPTAG
jgi:hypothetical protein